MPSECHKLMFVFVAGFSLFLAKGGTTTKAKTQHKTRNQLRWQPSSGKNEPSQRELEGDSKRERPETFLPEGDLLGFSQLATGLAIALPSCPVDDPLMSSQLGNGLLTGWLGVMAEREREREESQVEPFVMVMACASCCVQALRKVL